MSTADEIRALHAEGVPRVEIARKVAVSPEWVRQVTSKRTPEEIAALRGRVRLRSIELKAEGVWPWADDPSHCVVPLV